MNRALHTILRGGSGRRRRGLSTLEMVLCLPMLMMMMALMINYGTGACWKIRGLTEARCLAFASCWPKGSVTPEGCNSWSSPQTAGLSGEGDCSTLDDPRCNLPVARGVLENAGVYNEVLDPSRGFKVETASTTRSYPLLAKWAPYTLHAYVHMLDNKWQYGRQYSFAEGHNLWSNFSRRIPVIYALCKTSSTLSSNYVTCVYAVLRASFRTSLYPLDKDTEFIDYNNLFHWGSGAPDFHPRFQSTCSLDSDTNKTAVDNLVDRIQGKTEKDEDGNETIHIPSVAETMAQSFINLYQKVIDALKSQMNATPAPPDSEIANLKSQISTLESKIDTLQKFLNKIK